MGFDKFDPIKVSGKNLEEWLWGLPNKTDLRVLNTGAVLCLCNEKTDEIYMIAERQYQAASDVASKGNRDRPNG